jgi:hypothetical protein
MIRYKIILLPFYYFMLVAIYTQTLAAKPLKTSGWSYKIKYQKIPIVN